MTSATSNNLKPTPSSNFGFSPQASGTSDRSPASDWSSSRRSPGNPASSSAVASSSAPRKGQAARKQHRHSRRPVVDRDRVLDDMGPDMVRRPAELARGLPADASGLSAQQFETTTPQQARNGSSARRRHQTSITHLLDYSTPAHYYLDHGHGRSRKASWGPGSGHHPVDKARFVHANYRFVVSPTGDYAAHANDADKHVDWADIQQIIASAESQSTSCPICLSDPVAPRMARCGHIFCLPCLLRFVNSSAAEDESAARKEARWKKCPICEDSFKIAETRPVRFYAGQENPMPKPGDDVVLRLMVRESASTTALPKEGAADVVNMGEDIPWHFAASVLDYARIMKGTNEYMADQHDSEICQLRRQAAEDENMFGHEDGEWMQKAMRAIAAVRDKLVRPAPETGQDALLHNRVPLRPPVGALGKQQAAGPTFYFYTAPPHLYLSPLDIRILKTKFGDFSSFPTTLLPRVEHISTGHNVDDAMRRRARYLGHLPLGCVVSFLECDWTDIVPHEILETFGEQLGKRRREHHEKAAQEERERIQAERIEAAAIGRGVRRHFDLRHGDGDGGASRPAVNDDDFVPLGPSSAGLGSTPPGERAGFDSLAGLSTSPSESRTVWGTRAVGGLTPPEAVPPDDDDGWLREEDVLGTELEHQMEAFGLEGGGKKKKRQKITLMSTGGRRGL